MSKRIMITFPVSEQLRDEINEYCKAIDENNELSRAALCRIALKYYMEQNPAKGKKKNPMII